METLADVRRAFGLEGRPGRSAALSELVSLGEDCEAGQVHEGLVDALSASRARFSA